MTELPLRISLTGAGHRLSSQPLILVADDDARLARLVSIVLSAEGFRVVIATKRGRGDREVRATPS